MGFRSNGTCTVCGHETQNEYVCDGCQRSGYRELVESTAESRIKKLTKDNEDLSFFVRVHLNRQEYNEAEKGCRQIRENIEEIIGLKARLETYKLELSYDEIKAILDSGYGGGNKHWESIREKLTNAMS